MWALACPNPRIHDNGDRMGAYKYIRESWNLQEHLKEHVQAWRREPVTIRIDHPTRLDRARSLGYKAKQGIILVRQRGLRGGRKRPKVRAGRRSKRMTQRKDLKLNFQSVAERRANQAFPNCEVLNSYFVAQDGKNIWYEAILLDRSHPAILADSRFAWINAKRGRAFRGLTSANRKSRGLRHKGKGAEKMRPSLRAHGRSGN